MIDVPEREFDGCIDERRSFLGLGRSVAAFRIPLGPLLLAARMLTSRCGRMMPRWSRVMVYPQ